MIKEIIKDEFFLKQKSKECTKEDTYIAQELLETIQAYKDQCVGMAANMIGYQKTMMVVLDEDDYLILINPVILKTSNKIYIAEEGCLSLQGVRKTQRYESIKVSYLKEIIYVFLTIFLYLLKCPQSLILSALRAFCFCGKAHIPRSIFLYFRYQSWLKSW